MIRQVTGLNEARDASTPDPNSLVGVQKLAALNSNVATRHILKASLYITQRLAECLSIRTADVLQYSDFRDEFAMQIGKYILGILEGESPHRDEKGILTSSHGLVIDPKRKAAYERNKKVAKKLGFDIENLSNPEARLVAAEVSDDVSFDLGKDLGDKYNTLPPNSQALIIDAKFNTGKTYTDLTDALINYENKKDIGTDERRDSLRKVIAESRRTTDGKTTKGLDNRVAKLIFSLGYLEPTKKNVDFINKSFNTTGKANWNNIKGFYK